MKVRAAFLAACALLCWPMCAADRAVRLVEVPKAAYARAKDEAELAGLLNRDIDDAAASIVDAQVRIRIRRLANRVANEE